MGWGLACDAALWRRGQRLTRARGGAWAAGPRPATTGTVTVTAVVGGPALTTFWVKAPGDGPIGDQTAGTPFTIKITARDASTNIVTSFQGTVTITSTGTLSAGGTTDAFTAGGVAA